MSATKIEWADITINPTRGCSHCSPGCDNCYAERFAARLALNPKSGKAYAGLVDFKGKWTGRISDYDLSVFDRLPKTPKRIFVGSMTDMFHPNLDDNNGQGWRVMLQVMFGYPQHTFMVLTKRPEIMQRSIEWLIAQDGYLPPNLWLGVTVCNQAEADAKIPDLLATPAAKRFVSVEPMLGPVDLTSIDYPSGRIEGAEESGMLDALRGLTMDDAPTHPALDWVIAGGETGPGARPMHPDWVRGLRDQCNAAEVPFFFKSWGEWLPCSDCPDDLDFENHANGFIGDDGMFDAGNDGAFQCRNGVRDEQTFRVGKRTSGRLLDGQEHNEIPGVNSHV